MPSESIAHERAVFALRRCATSHGFFASGGTPGYHSVWGRDGSIGILGALLAPGDEFKETVRSTLLTLSRYQSERGQIPNCVDRFRPGAEKKVTFATIDSSLWFVIAAKAAERRYGKEFGKAFEGHIERAMEWVSYQDAGEEGLPEQQPTSDWQDCFPHKYGHALSTQALYYQALKMTGRWKDAEEVKSIINGGRRRDLCMFDSSIGHYIPWMWKSHNGYREQERWFDSLGNFLAVATGLAGTKQAKSVLAFAERKGIARPFPVRAIYPPIARGSPEWKPYFSKCLAAKPHRYINGGIWPFIGAFYVAALARAGKPGAAEKGLALLAEANRKGRKEEWEFNEWINPLTKRASGSPYHAWSAGGYLLAEGAVKKKSIPFFS